MVFKTEGVRGIKVKWGIKLMLRKLKSAWGYRNIIYATGMLVQFLLLLPRKTFL